MTIFPFQINEVIHLYSRVAKLKPSTMLEKEQSDPKDIVRISAEGKKKQVLEQTRGQVLERIRDTK